MNSQDLDASWRHHNTTGAHQSAPFSSQGLHQCSCFSGTKSRCVISIKRYTTLYSVSARHGPQHGTSLQGENSSVENRPSQPSSLPKKLPWDCCTATNALKGATAAGVCRRKTANGTCSKGIFLLRDGISTHLKKVCFGPPAMSQDLLLGRAVLPHLSLLKWGLPRTLLVLATVHRPFAG